MFQPESYTVNLYWDIRVPQRIKSIFGISFRVIVIFRDKSGYSTGTEFQMSSWPGPGPPGPASRLPLEPPPEPGRAARGPVPVQGKVPLGPGPQAAVAEPLQQAASSLSVTVTVLSVTVTVWAAAAARHFRLHCKSLRLEGLKAQPDSEAASS